MKYLLNENNWVYQVRSRTDKPMRKLIGIKCPHCGRFDKKNPNYEEWSVDAQEHITYCNPAHKATVAGERL